MKHQTPQYFLLCVLGLGFLAIAAAPASAWMPQDDQAAQAATEGGGNADGEWLKQAPEGSNAEIMMPSKPRLSERRFRPVPDEPFIKVKTYLCTSDGGQVVYTMSYHDLYRRPTTMADINKVLEGGVRGTVALVVGSLESNERVKVREYHGRKFTHSFKINGQALKSDAEVYVIGRRQYLLSVIFKEAKYDPNVSAKYLASFNPFDPEEPLTANTEEKSNDDDGGLSGFSLPDGDAPVELK